LKQFVCGSIIPGCDRVFTGPGDQSVLDQALEHAAMNHGLAAAAPMPFIELVLTYTRPFIPTGSRGHLRLVGRDDRSSGVATSLFADAPAAAPTGVGAVSRPQVVRHPGSCADGAAPAHGRLLRRPEWSRPRPSETHDTYRHECLLYAGIEEFLDAVVPFVRDGLDRQETVLVAIPEPRLSALRSTLAGAAERVLFADMADVGHNPAQIIPAWRDVIDRLCGAGHPVRGIGEPIWTTRHREVVVEAQLHEALLNVAVAPNVPLWLLCPYDTSTLADRIIVEATRSHPIVVESNTYRVSGRYGGADHVEQLFRSPFRESRAAVAPISFDPCNHGHVAEILTFAAAAGRRIVRAVNQVAAAANQDSRDVGIRVWSEQAAMICEVTDPNTGQDPMVGRGNGPRSVRDRAVRLANEMCDLVQVRSGDAGTATRIWCWL
jgi:predicted small metal-binding protein